MPIEIVPNIAGGPGGDGGGGGNNAAGSHGVGGGNGGAGGGYYEQHEQEPDTQQRYEAIKESPQSFPTDNITELLKYVFETLVKYVAKYVFVMA